MAKKFTSADIEIGAKDKTKAGISSAKKGIGGLTQAVKSYGAEIGAVVLAIRQGMKFIKNLTDAYGIQQDAIVELESALKSTGDYTPTLSQEMQDLASQLQSVTTYGDEATLSAAAMLQSLADLSGEGLKQAIPLVQDLAAGMGIDLKVAASLVGKTLGSTTNAMSRYGIVLDMTGTKSEKLAELQEQINQKFGGRAVALAGTYTGKMTSLKNAYSDLQESMGAIIADRMEPMIPLVKDLVLALDDLVSRKRELKDAYDKINEPMETYNSQTALGIRQAEMVIAQDDLKILLGQKDMIQRTLSGKLRKTELAEVNALIKARREEIGKIGLAIQLIKSVIDKRARETEGVDDLTEAVEEFDEAMILSGDRLRIYMMALESQWEWNKKVKESINDMSDAFVTNVTVLSTTQGAMHRYIGALAQAKAAQDDMSESISWANTKFEELQITADSVREMVHTGLTQAFIDFASASGDLSDKLGDLVKDTFSNVLRALGEQLLALAAFYLIGIPPRLAKAAAAAAAGTAAIVASGAIKNLRQGGQVSMQQGGRFGDRQPALLERGEVVIDKFTAARHPAEINAMRGGESRGLIENHIYIDGKEICKILTKASRNKQLLIYKGSVYE